MRKVADATSLMKNRMMGCRDTAGRWIGWRLDWERSGKRLQSNGVRASFLEFSSREEKKKTEANQKAGANEGLVTMCVDMVLQTLAQVKCHIE